MTLEKHYTGKRVGRGLCRSTRRRSDGRPRRAGCSRFGSARSDGIRRVQCGSGWRRRREGARREHPEAGEAVVSGSGRAVPGADGADARRRREARARSEAAAGRRRGVAEPPTTLGEEIDGFLDRLRAAGGLRPRSIEFYEQKAKVWKPLRGVRVSALRRAQVEDFIVERAAKHPRSALDELQFLKRVLREAQDAVSGWTRRS